MKKSRIILLAFVANILLAGCSSSKMHRALQTSLQQLLQDSALVHAHVGVMVADAAGGNPIAQWNEHRYFVPASNTKLWTLYAGMKYLGDSLVAGYAWPQADGSLVFQSNGDPSFLHPDYSFQPLAQLLKQYSIIRWRNPSMQTTAYGNGWSWNDYDATYMAPRSSMPMFGNMATFTMKNGKLQSTPAVAALLVQNAGDLSDNRFAITRKFDAPAFELKKGNATTVNTTLYVDAASTMQMAAAYLGNTWTIDTSAKPEPSKAQIIFSQPTDSLLRPLMHRSDNFFAEQTLLMVSNKWFGVANENAVIDSLLRTDFKALPDKPRWVDGSGLSRYNVFTPADYVWLLHQMHHEFGMQRLQDILPTGNDGTLTNYYKPLEGKIFAKTGTLAGVVALSGYLYALSGKLLLFSIIVNNHNGSAAAVRRSVEKYLLDMGQTQ
ncbi:MAG TPA: D-alanyl-D-alanine carboxypeptidase/D-alanyl-D-alanine-endopeptidase [Phnomibacter sp.]|nr:D-alanyl-D-alanine carboxypeptidase/D-alanyl-D-alanine-endopeptidase [Phnomibacter sp.]